MTIIEKIKQSVEGATGMPFLYHAAGEINELLARCKELPIAYSFLIDSGTIDDVNGRYHERVTIAVMFCDKTEFDFNAIENEEIINRMKVKAYKWMQSLRMSNALRIVSVNNTQRLYDNTTEILTGFAVNITLEDVAGVGECELPDVVFEIKENGEYPVVGVDKVIANVLPKSTDIVITENGEYHPKDYDVDGFKKVDVDVKPKLEEITATDNGTYTPSEGFDGFGKVNVDLRGKVKVSKAPRVLRDCLDENNEWKEGLLLDTRYCTSLQQMFYENEYITNAYCDDWETGNCTIFYQTFRVAYNLKKLNIKNWDTSKGLNFSELFDRAGRNVKPRWKLDVTGWSAESAINVKGIFNHQISVVGENTIEDVIEKNLCVLKGLKVSIITRLDADDRASLRAIINGLADLNGQETKVFNVTPHNSLTEEDIAIAVGKNWTIA